VAAGFCEAKTPQNLSYFLWSLSAGFFETNIKVTTILLLLCFFIIIKTTATADYQRIPVLLAAE